MIKDRLLKEVYAPIAYAAKNLVNIITSEEALYAYLGACITSVCFIMECADELVNAVVWSAGVLIGEEPAVEEVFVDENLYLPAAEVNLGSEILDWWREKAAQVSNVIDAEFWREDSPLLLEGAPMMLCLPAARDVVRPKPRKIKK